MVGFFKALSPLLLAAFSAAANLEITQPSSDLWWVAKSTNVLAWNCQSQINQPDGITNFTVLITNQNPAVLPGSLAFLAIQQNDQCSITVGQDTVDQPAATGYALLFANPLNNTDVYAQSQLFEIKPLGSLYPSQVSSSAAAVAGTATASSPSASPSKADALGMHSSSFIGLAGAMGLLVTGMLGA